MPSLPPLTSSSDSPQHDSPQHTNAKPRWEATCTTTPTKLPRRQRGLRCQACHPQASSSDSTPNTNKRLCRGVSCNISLPYQASRYRKNNQSTSRDEGSRTPPIKNSSNLPCHETPHVWCLRDWSTEGEELQGTGEAPADRGGSLAVDQADIHTVVPRVLRLSNKQTASPTASPSSNTTDHLPALQPPRQATMPATFPSSSLAKTTIFYSTAAYSNSPPPHPPATYDLPTSSSTPPPATYSPTSPPSPPPAPITSTGHQPPTRHRPPHLFCVLFNETPRCLNANSFGKICCGSLKNEQRTKTHSTHFQV